jgi:hypothetical protein
LSQKIKNKFTKLIPRKERLIFNNNICHHTYETRRKPTLTTPNNSRFSLGGEKQQKKPHKARQRKRALKKLITIPIL